jgi:hypothetical protein
MIDDRERPKYIRDPSRIRFDFWTRDSNRHCPHNLQAGAPPLQMVPQEMRGTPDCYRIANLHRLELLHADGRMVSESVAAIRRRYVPVDDGARPYKTWVNISTGCTPFNPHTLPCGDFDRIPEVRFCRLCLKSRVRRLEPQTWRFGYRGEHAALVVDTDYCFRRFSTQEPGYCIEIGILGISGAYRFNALNLDLG